MDTIVLICDDAYVMPTRVCIQSILDNSGVSNGLRIYVCSFALSQENVRALEGMSTQTIPVSVKILSRAAVEDKIRRVSPKTHVSTAALIKFELPNYFPELDQVLYLDSDIVVKGNLGELLQMDISNAYLAASFEYLVHFQNIRYNLHRDRGEEFYFNSGVMLLNLRKMREDQLSDRLWDYKLNHAKTKLMDQECLNAVCHSAVRPLSVKWNFNPFFLDHEDVREINKVYAEAYPSSEKLFEDVRILHYVGAEDKPWIYETATLRSYWQAEYDRLEETEPLRLQSGTGNKRGLWVRLTERVQAHGVIGLFCALRFKLERKCRRSR